MHTYETTTLAVAHKFTFDKECSNSKIMNQRDDFNDMFKAEADFRLSRGDESLVFCLSYNDEHLTFKYGQNLLNSEDLKIFAKSSAFCKRLNRSFGYDFDFVCVGEYGNGGKSHGVIGKRGVGQNPHYHCVGWFHKVSTVDFVNADKYLAEIGYPCKFSDGSFDYSPQVLLPNLIRYAWQGTFDNDERIYGKDFYKRSLGNGYVSLDGPILSSSHGGAYISKYLGKDMKKKFYQCYLNGFLPNLLPILRDEVRLSLNYDENESSDLVYDLCNDDKSLDDIISYWSDVRKPSEWFRLCRYIHKDFYIGKSVYNLPAWLISNSDRFKEVLDNLSEIYKLYYDEFYSDLNGIHSPKVRKFHGFGYSLLQNADLSDGSYTIAKPSGIVRRTLPPSLLRKAYYDYYVCVNPEGDKVVKYILNSNGRRLLKRKTDKLYQLDVDIIKTQGSQLAKDYIFEISLFDTYLSRYDIDYDAYSFDIIHRCLYDKDSAFNFYCDCVPIWVPENLEFLSRSLVDVHNVIFKEFPEIYQGYLELCKLKSNLRKVKDEKDEQFIESWSKIYELSR